MVLLDDVERSLASLLCDLFGAEISPEVNDLLGLKSCTRINEIHRQLTDLGDIFRDEVVRDYRHL